MFDIQGEVKNDEGTLEEYSRDRSSYYVRPEVVVFPRDEKEVMKVVNGARNLSKTITTRGAGSNVCGSAIGKGVVMDMSSMNAFISRKGRRVRVQPGIIYDKLNEMMKDHDMYLPYSPGSGNICTVGGNVGTKASGLGGVKYGSVDASLKSIKFVDAKGRLIDTSKPLPKDLEKSIMDLRKRLLNDKKVMELLKKREKIKTSCGYNIHALYRYSKPNEIVTHLMSGSVGTLGVFTELELELVPIPEEKITCLAFFTNLEDASKAVKFILGFGPSALEIMESSVVKNIEGIPANSNVVLVEFDDNLRKVKAHLQRFFDLYASSYKIETDPERQEKILQIRKHMLPLIEEIKKGKTIPFIEDVSIPVDHLAAFVYEMKMVLSKYKVEAAIFGHAGEGNLHIRPVIPKRNWEVVVRKLADDCFNLVFKHGGSITGEHGSGRNRSPYMEIEWGPDVYRYFKEIKDIFDKDDILNPDVMFSSGGITKNMVY